MESLDLKPLLVQLAKYCPLRDDNYCTRSSICTKYPENICCAFCEGFSNACRCPALTFAVKDHLPTSKQVNKWLGSIPFAYNHINIYRRNLSKTNHELIAKIRSLSAEELSIEQAGILYIAERSLKRFLTTRQMIKTFEDVLKQLSEEQQKLIRYKYLDQRSTNWIMNELNISRATFFRWKKKFIDKLKHLVAKHQL
jgi:RinA family phage transcriptional activator